MAKSAGKKAGNFFVWVILALLMLALAGFGVGNFGGSVRTVAEIGGEEISVQAYGNALQQEQRRLQQQTGQALTLSQMQAFGLDRAVLSRLIAGASLDAEATRLGLSVGDAEVARQIQSNPAFQGPNGTFDREGYGIVLRGANLTERAFEADVRKETARDLLQGAVLGGVSADDTYVATIASYIAETRAVTFAPVTTLALPTGPLAPTDADIQAHYEANADEFTRPEARQITYAWATPLMIVDKVEVSEEELRALYDARADEFMQPARVLAERLVFADETAAAEARAAIDAGTTSFDDLVRERGLTLDDVDIGEIAEADVEAPIAEALFGLAEPGLAGPVPTPLGPAIFRVNAQLSAIETRFEDVEDELRAEAAEEAARRRLLDSMTDIDDLLAAGATLEELAADTDLVLGQIAYSPDISDEIAGYDAFRGIASTIEEGDFPELMELSDGGLFAIRLDGTTPPTLPPLDEIRDAVALSWQIASDQARVMEFADAKATAIAAGATFEAEGLTAEEVTDLARDGFLDQVPPALTERAFATPVGETFTVADIGGKAWIARVDAIIPADMDDPETIGLMDAIRSQGGTAVAQDMFEAYGQAVQTAAGLTLNQTAINAVHASLTQ